MKVRITKGVVADGNSYRAGQEVELKINTASLLIAIGKAEKVTETPDSGENYTTSESLNESPVNRMESVPVKRGRKSKQA